jgi:hypothetical protein
MYVAYTRAPSLRFAPLFATRFGGLRPYGLRAKENLIFLDEGRARESTAPCEAVSETEQRETARHS